MSFFEQSDRNYRSYGPLNEKNRVFSLYNSINFQHALIRLFNDRNIENMSKHIDFSTPNVFLGSVS